MATMRKAADRGKTQAFRKKDKQSIGRQAISRQEIGSTGDGKIGSKQTGARKKGKYLAEILYRKTCCRQRRKQ
jgi:hypothetical protein